jgi:hypothetical protein
MVLGAEKSKVKALADLLSHEGLLPGVRMVIFCLYAHMVERE